MANATSLTNYQLPWLTLDQLTNQPTGLLTNSPTGWSTHRLTNLQTFQLTELPDQLGNKPTLELINSATHLLVNLPFHQLSHFPTYENSTCHFINYPHQITLSSTLSALPLKRLSPSSKILNFKNLCQTSCYSAQKSGHPSR